MSEEKVLFRDDQDDDLENQVDKTIKDNKHLLENMLYIPFRLLYKTSKINYMDAWNNSRDDINTISDRLNLIMNTKGIKIIDNHITNISPIGDIDRTYIQVIIRDNCITQEEKSLEIERYFTEIWFRNKNSTLNKAQENLTIIRQNMKIYLSQSRKSIDEVYEELKTCCKCVNEVQHTNYPAMDFIIVIPLIYEANKIIDFMNNYIEKTIVPENMSFIKLIDIEDSKEINIIKNNVDELTNIMCKSQKFEGVELLGSNCCYLYNISDKEIAHLYRKLARLKCRVDFDKRVYIEKLLKYKEKQGTKQPRYNSADNFKMIGYDRRGYDRWNYILAIDDNVKGVKSKPNIICNLCAHVLENTTIDSHLNTLTDCINCSGQIAYTLKIFKDRSINVHGSKKYDLSQIKEEDIINHLSIVKIYCRDCKDFFSVSIAHHINHRHGCKICSWNMWTVDKILIEGPKIYHERYDYQLIIIFGVIIKNSFTKIPVYCKYHKSYWWVTIANHLYNSRGCPICKCSKGELKCLNYLNSNSLFTEIQQQYIIQLDSRGNWYNKKFDFKFIYQGKKFLIEFDGDLHFIFKTHFHSTMEEFIKRQNIDIEKTQLAIIEGYFLIRIDYTQLKTNTIENHIINGIQKCLSSSDKYYLSDPEIYKYMIDKLNSQ